MSHHRRTEGKHSHFCLGLVVARGASPFVCAYSSFLHRCTWFRRAPPPAHTHIHTHTPASSSTRNTEVTFRMKTLALSPSCQPISFFTFSSLKQVKNVEAPLHGPLLCPFSDLYSSSLTSGTASPDCIHIEKKTTDISKNAFLALCFQNLHYLLHSTLLEEVKIWKVVSKVTGLKCQSPLTWSRLFYFLKGSLT